MKERILFMLLQVTVLPVLDNIIKMLEVKASATDSIIDDLMIAPFRAVVEMLKMPEFVEELKK